MILAFCPDVNHLTNIITVVANVLYSHQAISCSHQTICVRYSGRLATQCYLYHLWVHLFNVSMLHDNPWSFIANPPRQTPAILFSTPEHGVHPGAAHSQRCCNYSKASPKQWGDGTHPQLMKNFKGFPKTMALISLLDGLGLKPNLEWVPLLATSSRGSWADAMCPLCAWQLTYWENISMD